MKNKKTLYVLLFMALNCIEWIKATQDGDVWMVAVNCTGLVMFVMIMSVYPLREFINRLNALWTVLCGAAMVGVYLYWKWNVVPYVLWQYLTGVMNIWWIGLMCLYLFKKYRGGQWRKIKWNRLTLMWLILSLLMFLSVSGRVWPVWFLFMYGIFYLTEYTKEDRNALIEGMVNGTILSFFIIQIYAYGFRPYDEVRYKGAFGNCNMMALYYLIVYCMVLIKIHFLKMRGAKKGWPAFWTFGAGGLLAFQLMTLCRTAWLSAALVTVVYGILVMHGVWKDTFRRILFQGVVLAACTLVAFPLVFLTVRWLPTILHRPVWYSGEYDVDKVHSFDPPDSWKYVELDEYLEIALGRFVQIFQPAKEHDPLAVEPTTQVQGDKTEALTETGVQDREEIAVQGASENEAKAWEEDRAEMPILSRDDPWTSSTVRRAIWGAYWQDLNFRGHDETEGYYLITEEYRCWHAQNLWLQVAYYYGIPAGIWLILLMIYMIRFYLRGFGRGMHHRQYGVIPVMIVLLYFSFGLLETTWNPGQLILCLFFLVQHPMFRRADEAPMDVQV